MRVARPRRQGFTLVEILVALAIMVILFALLFAPMMAGLDWATTGRANVGLQDACRYAMEQIRRELGEAVYVYNTPGVYLVGRDQTVPNYSQILFCPPARDPLGKVYYPPRPAVDEAINVRRAIRYAVHLVDPASPYGMDNPFVLFRQEFHFDQNQAYPLGSYDSAGNWHPGVPLAENALTPRRGATFVPSTTVCLNCEAITDGYAPQCPACNSTNIMLLFNGVQFVPQRIVGEELQTRDGMVYRARYGAWDGASPRSWGYNYLPDNVALHRSELDPRVILHVWNPTVKGFVTTRPGMDSYAAATRTEAVAWNPDTGEIFCGRASGPRIVTLTQAGNGWYVATAGPPEITPIYPASTASPPPDTADAPTAYRLDPAVVVGAPALIEPSTVRLRLLETDNGGNIVRQLDLRPVTNFDQNSIAQDEFCVLIHPWDYDADGQPDGTCAEIRLSRWSPAHFVPSGSNLTQIEFTYTFRRNYTPDGANFVNDTIKVDYSTRSIQNVSISLQRYVDLEGIATGAGFVYKLPSDEYPNEVTLREQITARNTLMSVGH